MDIPVRWPNSPRMPLLPGYHGPLRTPDRPSRDERVDVPEVGESRRVSFSDGIAVRPGFPTRSGADRYRQLQEEAERAAEAREGRGVRVIVVAA